MSNGAHSSPPILGDVKMASISSIMDGNHDMTIVQVNEDKDIIVMEVLFRIGKDIVKVVLSPLVPC